MSHFNLLNNLPVKYASIYFLVYKQSSCVQAPQDMTIPLHTSLALIYKPYAYAFSFTAKCIHSESTPSSRTGPGVVRKLGQLEMYCAGSLHFTKGNLSLCLCLGAAEEMASWRGCFTPCLSVHIVSIMQHDINRRQ